MTKDQLYLEIKSGRRFKLKPSFSSFPRDEWILPDGLNLIPASVFYEYEIELEPLPEKTFTETQIKEAVDYATHPAYVGISRSKLLEKLEIKL